MKYTVDSAAQKIFAKMAGMSMIIFASLFGLALFTFALGTITNNSAKADNPTTLNNSGKIMMHQNSFIHDGQIYYQILVWDTETGKSKFYNLNSENTGLEKSLISLPASPLY